MSNNKMLIDASHPEETRVVVLRNGRVEEFDYELAARKLLRGNIYLAKVTRVEPSLQAAFIDYGGNRHGFLAFNEVHPDYYQIPVADRQALIEEEAAAEAEEEAEADARADAMAARRARHGQRDQGSARTDNDSDADPEDDAIDVVEFMPPAAPDEDAGETGDDAAGTDSAPHAPAPVADAPTAANENAAPASLERTIEAAVESPGRDEVIRSAPEDARGELDAAEMTDVPQPVGNVEQVGVEDVEAGAVTAEPVESVGSEDALEELPSRPRRRPRSYKIQEVIKRRQIILVQVVKEERGTKGAALTTYLSLAGRYTVLMPNTARGGGISRKITNAQDRKRLKAIAEELEVPEGMGLIIRTAGAARTKQEIKRDFEYLLRLWESVRDMTLQSTAPSLVYEEGDLIKRSIRDLYSKEVEEIVVAGDAAFKEARDFMRMLMPSHAKNVIRFEEPEPLFTRYQIERQLNAMFSPYVHLKSGGYLVINQTEALVAIDVNSGKATREFSIEETALNTNLEASDEIARQLKLRDLAGLIVIDFIDMEEKRNNRAVERRVKEALRFDRARIQVGHISHFGLLEMSRQRLRTGVLEGSTTQCPHCQGTGIIRSTESVALAVLRGLEDALLNGPAVPLVATTTPQVALYILNNKRTFIIDMEKRTSASITVQGSDKVQGANFTIERGARHAEPHRRIERSAVNMDWGFDGEGEGEAAPVEIEVEDVPAETEGRGFERRDALEEGGRDGDQSRRRRRRRGRRGDRPDRSEARSEDRGEARGESRGEGRGEARPFSTTGIEGDRDVRGNGHDDEDDLEAPGMIDPHGVPSDSDASPSEIEAGIGIEGEESEEARRSRRGRRRGRRGGRRGRGDRERPIGAENGSELSSDHERAARDFVGSDLPDAEANGAIAHGADDDDRDAGFDVPAAAPFEAAALPVATIEPVAVAARASSDAAPMMTVLPDASAPPVRRERVAEPQPRALEPAPKPASMVHVAAEAAASPTPEAVPEVKSDVAAAESRLARTAPAASEPVVARVVVTPDSGAAETEVKPIRRGWWSRK